MPVCLKTMLYVKSIYLYEKPKKNWIMMPYLPNLLHQVKEWSCPFTLSLVLHF